MRLLPPVGEVSEEPVGEVSEEDEDEDADEVCGLRRLTLGRFVGVAKAAAELLVRMTTSRPADASVRNVRG